MPLVNHCPVRERVSTRPFRDWRAAVAAIEAAQDASCSSGLHGFVRQAALMACENNREWEMHVRHQNSGTQSWFARGTFARPLVLFNKVYPDLVPLIYASSLRR